MIEPSYGATPAEEQLCNSRRRQPEKVTNILFSRFPHNCAFPKRVNFCFSKYLKYSRSDFFRISFLFSFSERNRACARHTEELVVTSEPMAAVGPGGYWRVDGWEDVDGRFRVEPP